MNMTSAAIALPFAPTLSRPERSSWPFIGASVLLQIGYCLFLEKAYRVGGIGQVYPIMRGIAPLFVALGAALIVGERLTVIRGLGMCILSAGILILAIDRIDFSFQRIGAAVGAGAFIAASTIVDGIGGRMSMHALAYSAWLFLLQGMLMPVVYRLVRGHFISIMQDRDTFKALSGGILAMTAYSAVIVALTRSPMGPVAALRETSIVMATLIGVIFLKEKLTWQRAVASLTISTGAIILASGL